MREPDRERLKSIFENQRRRGCIIREWQEWEEKVRKAYAKLVAVAREESLITYGELANNIGIPPLPDNEYSHLKIGWIAGACSQYELEDNHPLLSSLVVNKDTRMPGAGYWGFRNMPSHLRASNWEDVRKTPPISVEVERAKFWEAEVEKVHKHWHDNDRTQ